MGTQTDQSDGRRHLLTLIYSRRARDLFRKRYWVACWRCDVQKGPFRPSMRGLAEIARDDLDNARGCPC